MSKRSRRKQKTVEFFHGHKRSSDLPAGGSSVERARDRMRAPAGTSFLLFLCVAVMVAMAIVRIKSTTAVLEAGGDIAKLSEQQAMLLEEKRRLSAERAYLRNPTQVQSVARDELGMVPVAPELVQKIRVKEDPR
ncbi:MAG: cell division protein FtsL [Myxococcota bacterium]